MADLSEFEVFVFGVGSQDMAFDVEYVSIVIEKTDITPVPRAKKNVLGVMNLRGRIVPVIDLAAMLGLSSKDSAEGKIVVVNYEDIETGFLVERVRGVMRFRSDDVEKMQKFESFGEKSKGIIKKQEELIIHLNVGKILEELTMSS
ncbi:MAG: Putative CheW protein [Thermotoga sp. 50_1627]|uniref:chemotaxis protein CheW n=1 Tax=Pseudothermotoga sp. TaxID=2033661 RepID=UPI00076DB51E|nr:MAG: Putative CheW protein [Thermotoga sp. 50_64]KUK25424.1 MAG: Putative CheW protein [Thermotoga sp. 50_1627]MBC7116755.1 chemotaxis protein CheW [Pseudothermotoga sp.]MDK2923384.1 purine-binding chemotaxis protein CheW [Pseudothermotoga sp.]HBT39585.1 chemotaxis protein CheW [Pseudothermotoga sp.]